MKTLTIKTTAEPGHEGTVMDFLCAKTGLSRSRIKDAMSKGAVRIKKNTGKMLPERKGSRVLSKVNDLNSRQILFSLDGSSAITEFTVISFDPDKNSSLLTAVAKTGRYHQVRRHFNMTGHPVIGDPKYGQGNKNIEGMKLSAVALRYHCPVLRKDVEVRVPDEGTVFEAEAKAES